MGKGMDWNRAKARRPSESVNGEVPRGDGYAWHRSNAPDKAELQRLAEEALARGMAVKREERRRGHRRKRRRPRADVIEEKLAGAVVDQLEQVEHAPVTLTKVRAGNRYLAHRLVQKRSQPT